MGRKKPWRRLLIGLVLLLFLSTGALAHIGGGPRQLARLLLSLDPLTISAAMLALFIGEIVKAWRLTFISERTGRRVPLRVSALARFSGRFVGVLTPAYTGAAPTRSLIISAYTGAPPGESFSLATMESILDTILSVIVVLLFTAPLLPESWLVFLVSLCIGASWLLGVFWAGSDGFARFIRRLRLPENLECYILNQRDLFMRGLREASRMRVLTPSLLITVLSHIIESIALLIIITKGIIIYSLGLVVKSFILMEATYVLSMSITPGGSLFFEYGLAGLLSPEDLLAWRVVYLLFSILPGLIIVVALRPVRHYIEEALEREVTDCAGGI